MKKRRGKSKKPLVWHLALGVGVALIATGWYWGDMRSFFDSTMQAASVFFFDSSTSDMLHTAYAAASTSGKPVSMLIVPGHDQAASGTSYRGISEADLTLATGQKLMALFAGEKNIAPLIARQDGWYIPALADFFVKSRATILEYRASQISLMDRLVSLGQVHSDIIVDHNVAPGEVALRLYGINLWANQNGVNFLIHIHYNDIPRANRAVPGPYTGFAIYIPEHQYSNYKGSLALAQAIEKSLEAHGHTVSTHPLEKVGIIEDQGLIATGSHNSVDAAAVLVECAYIYEPQLQTPALRDAAEQSYAASIYQGIENFFASSTVLK